MCAKRFKALSNGGQLLSVGYIIGTYNAFKCLINPVAAYSGFDIKKSKHILSDHHTTLFRFSMCIILRSTLSVLKLVTAIASRHPFL